MEDIEQSVIGDNALLFDVDLEDESLALDPPEGTSLSGPRSIATDDNEEEYGADEVRRIISAGAPHEQSTLEVLALQLERAGFEVVIRDAISHFSGRSSDGRSHHAAPHYAPAHSFLVVKTCRPVTAARSSGAHVSDGRLAPGASAPGAPACAAPRAGDPGFPRAPGAARTGVHVQVARTSVWAAQRHAVSPPDEGSGTGRRSVPVPRRAHSGTSGGLPMIRVGGRFTRPARIFVVTPSAAAPERPSEASATEAEAPGTLIVDPAFKTLVRVAHPTPEYERVLDGMPDVFVGSPQRLERTMAYLSTFVRSSFAANGTDVPPWRRLGSMLERWTRARSYEDRRPSLDTTAQDARPRCAVPCDDKGQLHYHTGPVTSPTYFGFLPCGNFVTPRH